MQIYRGAYIGGVDFELFLSTPFHLLRSISLNALSAQNDFETRKIHNPIRRPMVSKEESLSFVLSMKEGDFSTNKWTPHNNID